LYGVPSTVAPAFSCSFTSGCPTAASSVGSQSSCDTMSLISVPGWITPGQRMTIGTR